jgi:hypothetical protein
MKRLPGAGRKLIFSADEDLARWCRNRRRQGDKVSRRIIQVKALEMHDFQKEISFKVDFILSYSI